MRKIVFILLALIWFLPGCTSRQQNSVHSHDEVVLYLTGYGGKLEVFAEAKPLAVGQNSDIFAHFTHLTDFKPLEEATVTMSLVVGRHGVRQTVEAPNRKGIFAFTLQPGESGRGLVVFDVVTPEGQYSISIPNVMVYDNLHDAEHAAEDLKPADPNAISFTKEQSWKVDFATEVLQKASIGQVIKTTAQVLPAQGDELLITARTSGTVIFGGAALAEGRTLSRGAVLMNISSAGMADNNMVVRMAEARNNFEKTRANLQRAEKLAIEKIISERELLLARTEFENARAVYENLAGHFSQSGQSVISPAQGFIKRIWVENGQYVEAGQPLLSIMQNRRLQLRADVRPSQAQLLQSIKGATIKSLHNNRIFTLEELNGRLVSAGQATNTQNHMVQVILEVEQNGELLPGSFAALYLIAPGENETLTVLNSALLEEQGLFYVFVQINPELFTKREVSIGATDGVHTVIKKGIEPQERVVTKGAVWVKLAQSSAALDPHAGHVH